jgi:MFS family permease
MPPLVASSGFVWTAVARRQVNVLVAMQAMHMAAGQVVVLASEDLLVELLQAKARLSKGLIASLEGKLELADAGSDEAAAVAARDEFEQSVKIQANSRAAHIMSTIQVVIALGDFVIGPLLGAAADAYGRKGLVLVAPAVQGLFRLAIAMRPSVPLFVAFQMAQVSRVPDQSSNSITYFPVSQRRIGTGFLMNEGCQTRVPIST